MVDSYALKEKITGLESWQKYALMMNAASFQLTTHCSIGCPDCGSGAEPAKGNLPREGYSIAFDLFEEILTEFGNELRSHPLSLYDKNEPFDYHSQGRKFRDAYNLLGHKEPIKTGVPAGAEEEVVKSLDIIQEIQIHKNNYKRLKDFKRRVETKFPHYRHIFTAVQRLPLGPENTDHLNDFGIQCAHGVSLTPEDIFTTRAVKPSRKFPYGFERNVVHPDDFKISALSMAPNISPLSRSNPDLKQLYDRWVAEGSYVIDSPDKILFPPLSDYNNFRFIYLSWLTQPPENSRYLAALENKFQFARDELPKRIGRNFNGFECGLLEEMNGIINRIKEYQSG